MPKVLIFFPFLAVVLQQCMTVCRLSSISELLGCLISITSQSPSSDRVNYLKCDQTILPMLAGAASFIAYIKKGGL